jgi:predicted aconitase with swiveling domain
MTPQEAEARKELVAAVHNLSTRLLEVSKGESTQVTLLAAETVLAIRAVAAGMPLQDLMNNLLANMPQMYTNGVAAVEEKKVGIIT